MVIVGDAIGSIVGASVADATTLLVVRSTNLIGALVGVLDELVDLV